ncbi:DUF3465 domain-containing protein [Acinetobacter sp. NIPH 1852]|uniref:DUF3465 domain-containing protein n=1 Tax=Acinetobacter sp. NIPH 1852 TaxID=2923428 RepID=UPI001B7A5D8B|nr:DUF3465 domain-containing protein [Acinetobacter sp. NIPH 1852]MBP8006112.1 DUF3465 domain-containing protein [Acinetobacter sp.]MCH7307993.1 DUF3465 domain-containing protein [Acinetobacter sp. NIPH 1852]
MKTQKNNVLVLIVITLLIFAYVGLELKQKSTQFETSSSVEQRVIDDQAKIMQAYQQQRSKLQVRSQGIVKAILPDDNDGSRHQRMILELDNGLTVLIAHNIDLAPRIEGLQKGETVEFYGVYEYNNKGGVIHWTHHDPRRKHIDGWLKYKGRMYQ